MEYIAIIDEEMLSDFRIDDPILCDMSINDKVLVVNDKLGFTRGIQLKPLKKGHWIKYGIPKCEEQHYKCTLCGYYINFGQWGKVYTKQFKYCPNCGAEMEGEQVFGNNEYYPECEEFIVSNEQVKYIEIVEKVKESLSKILFSGEERKIGLANEDMDHGALVAYEDIYNFIWELEHEVDND